MIYSRPDEEFNATLTDAATGLTGTLGVRIENTDGSNLVARTTAGIVELEPDSGIYAVTLVAPSERGTYVIIWDDGDSAFAGEELHVVSSVPTAIPGPDPITDLSDTRVLIPRVRRALQGPDEQGFGGSASATTVEWTDDEINALIADAVADVILYSGTTGFFGYQLEVVARDEHYLAPTAWKTSEEMSLPAQSVIAAQAALTHFTQTMKGMKVKETIEDEGQHWDYDLGVSFITEQIKGLRADRDAALEALARQSFVTDDYVNFLAIRDSYTDALIEPWASGGALGGQTVDPRFF